MNGKTTFLCFPRIQEDLQNFQSWQEIVFDSYFTSFEYFGATVTLLATLVSLFLPHLLFRLRLPDTLTLIKDRFLLRLQVTQVNTHTVTETTAGWSGFQSWFNEERDRGCIQLSDSQSPESRHFKAVWNMVAFTHIACSKVQMCISHFNPLGTVHAFR